MLKSWWPSASPNKGIIYWFKAFKSCWFLIDNISKTLKRFNRIKERIYMGCIKLTCLAFLFCALIIIQKKIQGSTKENRYYTFISVLGSGGFGKVYKTIK